VAVGEHLYAVTGQFLPWPAAHLHCVEANTGKILWTRKDVGKYHATVMLAKDQLLLLEEEGNLALVEPSPQGYKELARAKVCGHTWAHPALSDGRLLVRDEKEVICVQLAKKQPMTLHEKIDVIVQPILDEKKAIGLVVGVIDKRGRQIYGYGKLSADSDKKPDGETVFEIGSITKVFTALLLADMAEEGLVKLDDPVQKYLPEGVKVPKRGEKEMTLLHLATHTSGLPRIPLKVLLKPKNPYADFTPNDLYDFLGNCSLIHDVGDKFEYSNLGGGLLGHLLSLRANQPYEELILHRIAEPLGMKSTRITLTPSMRERLASGYTADGKPAENWDFGCLTGCGALRSTANDMLTFAAANLGFTKIRLAPALAACRQLRHDAPPSGEVGLGWMLSKSKNPDKPNCWHDGGTGGYSSFLFISRANEFAVIVLANTSISLKESVVHKVGGEVARALAVEKAPEKK
jgi:CubicO group peptidase (beta-lactamase class C family)